MGTVTVYTAAHMKAIEDATVTSMTVNATGRLIVTRRDNSTFDAGDVSTWLPGRLKTANNLGPGNDPNSLTDTGWYSGYSWANSLSGYSIGMLEVLNYSSDWIVQKFWVPGPTMRWYTRSRFNGTTWSSWVERDVAATITVQGEVLLATDADAVIGTNTTKAITPHSLAATVGVNGVITGAAPNGAVTVLLSDGVTIVSAIFSPDAKQLASNNVLLDRYPNGTYVITASQPQQGFIAQPFDYINPKLAWYNGQTTDTLLYSPPWAYRSPGCWVSLTGMLRVSGSIVAGDILVTLPPAFRPLQNKLVTALINGNSYLVLNVAPNGNVTLFQSSMTSGYWFTFDGIQFNNNTSLIRTPLALANGFQAYSATDYTPQYVADDGYGRTFVEGMVKQTSAIGGSGSPIALTSANPGLQAGGALGTLHRVASISAGWKRLNYGYSSTGLNLSQELASVDVGVSLEIFMPTNTLYTAWSGMLYSGTSNRDYGSGWRLVKEGIYGDGMYGLTGLAYIATGGTVGTLKAAFSPKYNILQQPEASGVGNGRMDILAGSNPLASRNYVQFVAGAGTYVGFEEYAWVPVQFDSALHA